MEFRPATQEDLEFVRQNPFEGAIKNYPYMEVPSENTYAAIYEGELVAVGGLQVRWEGVGMLWLMLTEKCKKDGLRDLRVLYAIKDKVDFLLEKNNIWRAEAYVRTDFPKAIKMIEHLGFKRECKMEKHCPDKGDSYLYAKVT